MATKKSYKVPEHLIERLRKALQGGGDDTGSLPDYVALPGKGETQATFIKGKGKKRAAHS